MPLHDVPADLLNFQPDAPAVLNDAAVAQALRTARRGTAAGLSGATCEHYKLLLDDAEALELFTHAANLLIAARVPASVAAALGLSRFTALRKPGGGVRGRVRTRGRPGTGTVRLGPTRRPRCCRRTAATRRVSRGLPG